MRRSGVVVVHIALAVILGSGAVAQATEAFRRGRLVKQVSASPFADVVTTETDETDTEFEPHIAVDPTDPSIVVAVTTQGETPYRAIGVATSHDGGRTWTSGSLPDLAAALGGLFDRPFDPVVAFGPDGAIYAQTTALNGTLVPLSPTRTSVVVQRSDNGGLTFGSPMLIQDDQGAPSAVLHDKSWIAVDGFPASPYYGRVYSAWQALNVQGGAIISGQIVLRHSDDRGTTWSDLLPVSGNLTVADAQPVVQPNGDLTIAYSSIAPCAQLSQTSHDGGEHFDAPVTIGACTTRTAIAGMRTGLFQSSNVFLTATVDPVNGLLYVVWEDSELRSDGLHAIALSVSSDGGASWTPPRAVRDSDRVHQFTPAVTAYDGAVLVSFRSMVPDEDRVFTRYVASTDAGITFGRERKLGKAGNLQFAYTSKSVITNGMDLRFLGDYMGLAMSADAAHAVWCRPSRPRRDSPSPHHQTTWSATIPRSLRE